MLCLFDLSSFFTQAVVGVSFSLGFIFGPSIGAWFSSMGRNAGHSFAVFQYPAYFALITGVLTLLLVVFFFKETLPQSKRVSALICKFK